MRKSNWPVFIDLITQNYDPCYNSIPIIVGGHNITVTTNDVIPVITNNEFDVGEDENNGTATINSTASSIHTSIPECSSVSDLPNAWLQVRGNGNAYTISTCNENTQDTAILTVLEGPLCGGEQLICPPFYYDEGEILSRACETTHYASQVSWMTTPGSLYRIVVSTVEPQTQIGVSLTEQQVISPVYENDNMHYVLYNHTAYSDANNPSSSSAAADILKSSTTTKTNPPLSPTNDSYQSSNVVNNNSYDAAIAIEVDAIDEGGSSTLVNGSTVHATFDDKDVTGFFCGTNIVSPGIWYVVIGQGFAIQISTCSQYTNYDTAVSVFTTDAHDDGNDGLRCIGGNNNDILCGYQATASTVSFFADVNVTFYILVHHGASRDDNIQAEAMRDDGNNSSSVGSFGLNITSFHRVENDDCQSAISLSLGNLQSGSTLFATIDEIPNNNPVFFCGVFVGIRNGVWYRAVGTGELFIATTCTAETDYNTAISVFSGNCSGGFAPDNDDNESSALQCIGGNDDDFSCDDDPFGKSTFGWTTIPGKVYYILVHGSYFSDSIDLFSPGYGNFGLLLTAS